MRTRLKFLDRYLTLWIFLAMLFERIASSKILLRYNLPALSLNHIKNMTTNFGIIQFSKNDQPDISTGFTIDDNARAMVSRILCLRGGLKTRLEKGTDADGKPNLGRDLPQSPMAIQQGVYPNQMDHNRKLVAFHKRAVLECIYSYGR